MQLIIHIIFRNKKIPRCCLIFSVYLSESGGLYGRVRVRVRVSVRASVRVRVRVRVR